MTKLPSGVDIHNLIDDLRNVSWEAADILLYYSNSLKKSNNVSSILDNNNLEDPVTKADLKVNELIIKTINEKYKNIEWDILSEENAKKLENNSYLNSRWVWILDPLDGTKDFIQGTENYAMHLALNYDGRPYLGLVLIPFREELWISNGLTVWCEKRNGTKLNPNLSNVLSLKKMTLVSSKNHSNQNLKDLIEKIEFKNMIIMGSIGCKVASIIRGDCDVYISLSLPGKRAPKDWDFAAPEAILRAAGGIITTIENKNLSYNEENFEHGGIIIASNNKENHRNVCLKIKDIIKEYDLYPLNS